jgi:hypothetical protein
MEIRHLLRSQTNQIFETVASVGLNPSEFDWKDATGPFSGMFVSKLIHSPSNYFFIFDNLGYQAEIAGAFNLLILDNGLPISREK